jgi:hypothetical protein
MTTDVPLARLSPGTLVEGQTFVDEDISHLAGIEFFTCRFEGWPTPACRRWCLSAANSSAAT